MIYTKKTSLIFVVTLFFCLMAKAADNYLYLSNGLNITRCNILASGSVSGCVDAGAYFLGNADGIAIDPISNFFYATNFNTSAFRSPSVTRCTLNPLNGELDFCVNAGAPAVSRDTDIVVIPEWSLAYIVNLAPTDAVTKCNIDPIDGIFSDCTSSGATLDFYPKDMIVNTHNSVAYLAVGSVNSYKVIKCNADSITGKLNNCVDSGVSFGPYDAVRGLAINYKAPAYRRFIYITQGGPLGVNKIQKCNVDNISGDLHSCVDSGASGLVWPRAIAFNQAGTQVYITNGGTELVTRCNVAPTTGLLSGCVDAGATDLSSSGIAVY